ncbi:hypothetical protein L915_03772, partial [Phytophthora nicotianae]
LHFRQYQVTSSCHYFGCPAMLKSPGSRPLTLRMICEGRGRLLRALACGDVMKLQIQADENGFIKSIPYGNKE